MKKALMLLVMLLTALTSCNFPLSQNQTAMTPSQTLPSTVNTVGTSATRILVSSTPSPITTLTAQATPSLIITKKPTPITYYCFVAEGATPPAGSVAILPNILVLAPMLSTVYQGADAAANLKAGLQAALKDPNNAWTSTGVTVANLVVANQKATVTLQGEYFAPGDVVLIAARWQILLTLFAEPAIQSTVVTLNGTNIANLGVSHSSQAQPATYEFTRQMVNAFIQQNGVK